MITHKLSSSVYITGQFRVTEIVVDRERGKVQLGMSPRDAQGVLATLSIEEATLIGESLLSYARRAKLDSRPSE